MEKQRLTLAQRQDLHLRITSGETLLKYCRDYAQYHHFAYQNCNPPGSAGDSLEAWFNSLDIYARVGEGPATIRGWYERLMEDQLSRDMQEHHERQLAEMERLARMQAELDQAEQQYTDLERSERYFQQVIANNIPDWNGL